MLLLTASADRCGSSGCLDEPNEHMALHAPGVASLRLRPSHFVEKNQGIEHAPADHAPPALHAAGMHLRITIHELLAPHQTATSRTARHDLLPREARRSAGSARWLQCLFHHPKVCTIVHHGTGQHVRAMREPIAPSPELY